MSMRSYVAGTVLALIGLAVAAIAVARVGHAQSPPAPLGGAAAFGSWRDDAPGKRRHITADALPAPFASPSAGNVVKVVRQPGDAQLKVPSGFEIKQFASGLGAPRLMRAAPNGDIF